jgi:hypothetical protein
VTADCGGRGSVDSPTDGPSARRALVRRPDKQPAGAEFTEAVVAAAHEHMVGGAIKADDAEAGVVCVVRDAQRDDSSSILCSRGLLSLRVQWILGSVNA